MQYIVNDVVHFIVVPGKNNEIAFTEVIVVDALFRDVSLLSVKNAGCVKRRQIRPFPGFKVHDGGNFRLFRRLAGASCICGYIRKRHLLFKEIVKIHFRAFRIQNFRFRRAALPGRIFRRFNRFRLDAGPCVANGNGAIRLLFAPAPEILLKAAYQGYGFRCGHAAKTVKPLAAKFSDGNNGIVHHRPIKTVGRDDGQFSALFHQIIQPESPEHGFIPGLGDDDAHMRVRPRGHKRAQKLCLCCGVLFFAIAFPQICIAASEYAHRFLGRSPELVGQGRRPFFQRFNALLQRNGFDFSAFNHIFQQRHREDHGAQNFEGGPCANHKVVLFPGSTAGILQRRQAPVENFVCIPVHAVFRRYAKGLVVQHRVKLRLKFHRVAVFRPDCPWKGAYKLPCAGKNFCIFIALNEFLPFLCAGICKHEYVLQRFSFQHVRQFGFAFSENVFAAQEQTGVAVSAALYDLFPAHGKTGCKLQHRFVLPAVAAIRKFVAVGIEGSGDKIQQVDRFASKADGKPFQEEISPIPGHDKHGGRIRYAGDVLFGHVQHLRIKQLFFLIVSPSTHAPAIQPRGIAQIWHDLPPLGDMYLYPRIVSAILGKFGVFFSANGGQPFKAAAVYALVDDQIALLQRTNRLFRAAFIGQQTGDGRPEYGKRVEDDRTGVQHDANIVRPLPGYP